MLPVRNISAPRSTEPPRRAAVVCRVSTAEQAAEGRAGLQRQHDQTQRVIHDRGYELVASFEVVDVSGTSVAYAPEFQRLLELVASGEVQVVVVSELSRLVRPDSLESLSILDHFARHNCLIVADGQDLDFSDPSGFLSGSILAILSGHERMTLLRKVAAAKEANRRKGWLTTSLKTLPLGVSYDKTARRFFYNEQIHRVIEAFRLLDEEHLSLSEIGRRIGIHPHATRGVLENEIYIGWRVYDEKRDLSLKRLRPGGRQGSRPKIARAPEEVIRVRVIDEPAVSLERFARVQAALAEVRRNHSTSNAARHPSLCTHIGRCGYCGEPLYVTANGKKRKDGQNYGYYCCKSRYPEYTGKLPKCGNGWVRRESLDEVLVAFSQKTLSDPTLLTVIIEASLRRSSEVVCPFPGPSKDEAVAKLRQKDARLVEMCESEVITIDEFRARRAKLRQEIQRMESIAEQAAQSTPGLSVEQFARLVTRAALRFSFLQNPREQKQILTQLFAEVLFRGESITAFRFSRKFLADLGSADGFAGETIQLETPFRIREPAPPGHKRCKSCGQFRPFSDYYQKRAQCRPCYLKRHRALKTARQSAACPDGRRAD